MLNFTPYAWAKLEFLRDVGNTEIGGFGISETDDVRLITDFVLVKQECTSVKVDFDDDSVADFFDDMIDRGLQPYQFARHWIHTHPGNSATPSGVDNDTFERVFGDCDWSVMFILAKGGECSGLLQIRTGFPVNVDLSIDVDYHAEFPATDREAWLAEYKANVTKKFYTPTNNHITRNNSAIIIPGQQSPAVSHYNPDDYRDNYDNVFGNDDTDPAIPIAPIDVEDVVCNKMEAIIEEYDSLLALPGNSDISLNDLYSALNITPAYLTDIDIHTIEDVENLPEKLVDRKFLLNVCGELKLTMDELNELGIHKAEDLMEEVNND